MDHGPRTNRPAVRATGAGVVAAIVLGTFAGPASCGKDEDTSADDRPRSTTTTTLTPEAEVEAAYKAYRQMVKRLLGSPDPSDPEIGERASGDNASFLVEQLRALAAAGRAIQFGPRYRVEIRSISVNDAQATVQDCTVDDARTVEIVSSNVVSSGTTTDLLEATMEYSQGRWRVKTVERLGHWDGVASCDL